MRRVLYQMSARDATPAVSGRNLHAFRFRKALLVRVEGEKGVGADVKGCGHVEDIGEAMPMGFRVTGAEIFSSVQNLRPICWCNAQNPGVQVRLQVAQHFFAFPFREAARAVMLMQARLKTDRLPELEKEQDGNGQGAARRLHKPDGPLAMLLLSV